MVGVAIPSAGLAAGPDAARAEARAERAAQDAAHLSQIVSPRRDAVARGGTLRVDVRVEREVRDLRATIDGRNVGARFMRKGARHRVARLAVGSLAPGSHTLTVETRGSGRRWDFDAHRFHVARRSGSLLSLRVTRPARPGVVPVEIRAARSLDRLVVRLNGQRVSGHQLRPGGLRWATTLSASDGLRHGRNRVTVFAHRRDGSYDLERRSVTIARRAPLPGAGRDRQLTPGRALQLSAGDTRPADPASALRHRWRIVRAPRGSKARLSAAGTSHPRLKPDVHGRYVIELGVSEDAPRGAGISAAPATDRVSLAVIPKYPPIGAPVDLHAYSSTYGGHGIAIGDPENLANFCGTADNPGQAFLASYDRVTLERNQCDPLPADATLDQALTSQLEATKAPNTPPGTWIYVVSAPPGCCDQSKLLGNAGDSAVFLSGDGVRALQDAEFRNTGALLSDPANGGPQGQPGAIRGNMMRDTTDGAWAFVNGDRVTFQTRRGAPTTGPLAGQLIMQVGTRDYLQPFKAGHGGFMAVALDPALRPVGGTPTLWETNTGNRDVDSQSTTAMAAALKGLASTPGTTVLIQSIGAPKPTGGEWDQVAQQIMRLGGSRESFNRLDGSGDYAFVGCAGCPPGQPEANYPLTPHTDAESGQRADHLNGVLVRNDKATWQAEQAVPYASFDTSISMLAYQPTTTSWPGMDAPGQRAALGYVADKLGLTRDTCGTGVPVRENYCSANIVWSDERLDLQNLAMPAGSPGFTQADLDAVKGYLASEFAWVGRVRLMIRNLQGLFDGSQLSKAFVNVAAAANEVKRALAVPPAGEAPFSVLDVFEDVMTFGTFVAHASPETREIIEVVSTIFTIGDRLGRTPEGEPELFDAPVAANEIDAVIAERFETAAETLGRIGDLLVTDPAKLQTAYTRANHEWSLDDQTLADRRQDVANGIQRWLWGPMMASAFRVIKLDLRTPAPFPDPQLSDIVCQPYDSQVSNWRPWDTTSRTSRYLPAVGGTPAAPQWWTLGHGRFPALSSKRNEFIAPLPSLTDRLFVNQASGGPGLVPELFWTESGFAFEEQVVLVGTGHTCDWSRR